PESVGQASQLVVLRIGCPSAFVHTFCLAAQGFDGNLVCRLDQFMCHRFKLFQDRGGISKLCAGRQVFQVGRLVACDRGERRKRAVQLVSRFAGTPGTEWLRLTPIDVPKDQWGTLGLPPLPESPPLPFTADDAFPAWPRWRS